MSGSGPIGVHLEAGASLLTAVEEIVSRLKISFCDVTGFGELEWIELGNSQSAAPVRIEGPVHLLDLKGRLRRAGDLCISEYVCTASHETAEGQKLVFGELAAAAVKAVELTLTPLVAAERPDKTSVPSLPEDSTGRSKPVKKTALTEASGIIGAKWAKAVAESRRMERLAKNLGEHDSDERPEKGDIVDHRQFGRCTVVSIDGEHITLRKPNKRTVQLGMLVLRFSPKNDEDGRRVFNVEVYSK